MPDFAALRERMVERQLAARGIADHAVLDAFRAVPREPFVEAGQEAFAYDDRPLSIGEGQTISQPYMVALMIEAARLTPGSAVLEVGAGSGYAAAVLGRIAARVVAVERHAGLPLAAARRIAALGLDNVTVVEGDGTLGWPAGAPFDAILVAASGPEAPEPLLDQLVSGGRLVIPLDRGFGGQQLVRITRHGGSRFEREALCGVRFVPLIGAHGHPR